MFNQIPEVEKDEQTAGESIHSSIVSLNDYDRYLTEYYNTVGDNIDRSLIYPDVTHGPYPKPALVTSSPTQHTTPPPFDATLVDMGAIFDSTTTDQGWVVLDVSGLKNVTIPVRSGSEDRGLHTDRMAYYSASNNGAPSFRVNTGSTLYNGSNEHCSVLAPTAASTVAYSVDSSFETEQTASSFEQPVRSPGTSLTAASTVSVVETTQNAREVGQAQLHCGREHPPGSNKWCTKLFSTSDDLRHHQRNLDGPRPYICRICALAFLHPKDLRRHEETHITTGLRLRCPGCSKTYGRQDNLSRHIRNSHGGMQVSSEANSAG